MPFIRLQYPPGLYRNGTEYQSQGRWHDGRYIRWNDGALRPMRGWVNRTPDSPLAGHARAMHSWTDADFTSYIATVSDIQVRVFTGDGSQFATPIGLDGTEDGSWTLGNFGESLIGCKDDDGIIYRWRPGEVRMTPLENAPEAVAIVITEPGFVVALGAGGDPRSVRTSNLRQPTIWTPALINQAREFTLQTSGQIVAGQQIQGGTLIFTSEELYVMTYTATGPLYHRIQKVPGSRGLLSRNAKATVDTTCYFMSNSGFWSYNGFVTAMACDIEDDVFTHINRDHSQKVYAFHNADEQEIWWLYPRGTATENSHYVTYNYTENTWNHGELARNCGIGPGGGFNSPFMLGRRAVPGVFYDLYQHETGFDYDGDLPFVRGGPLELGSGDEIMEAFEMIPDEANAGSLDVIVRTRFYPNDTEYTYGPYQSDNPMGVRFAGRQASLELRATAGVNWRAGGYRVNAQPGGTR